jgi:hypothetical protein
MRMLRLVLVIGAWAVCVSIVATAVGCGESYEKRLAREEQARKDQARAEEHRRSQVVAELREHYAANDVPAEAPSAAWTADVQDMLAGNPAKAVVGIARLYDIERAGDSFLLYMRQGDIVGPIVEFVLRCSRPEAKPPRVDYFGEATGFLDAPEYAFAAKIDRVRRSDTIERDGGRRTVDARRRWIAEGTCLALRPLKIQNAPSPVLDNEPWRPRW